MRKEEKTSKDDHRARVRRAFDSFGQSVGGRLDETARKSVEQVREAAEARDGNRLRGHLNDLSKHHGWLYRELATHPEIANLLDELALLGL